MLPASFNESSDNQDNAVIIQHFGAPADPGTPLDTLNTHRGGFIWHQTQT